MTDPTPYLGICVAALEAAGVEISGIGALAHPVRSRRFRVGGAWRMALMDHDDTFYDAGLGWHEETGWTVHETSEPGAVRGYLHTDYAIGSGIVPAPAELAAEMLALGRDMSGLSRRDGDWKARRASVPDPALEAALASHAPLREADPALIAAARDALTAAGLDHALTRPLAGPDGLEDGEHGSLLRLGLHASALLERAVDDGEVYHANLEWRSRGGWSLALGVWRDEEMGDFRVVRRPLALGPDAEVARVAAAVAAQTA
ncbi:hypothetical protein Afil01_67690 [Actinorhabdospora filicis]|uniref:Uncharacterized protein n=1 Tax=Actinorhabdospora filicis TaxID=1785913 RepID=A0A9W6SUA7_9ACTN|nr:DUF6292 family protein [Actinorhabdospora filicis]GLZ81962.1 hypothetical protein Afil01_67690 [Actinorhabdospora filicis]